MAYALRAECYGESFQVPAHARRPEPHERFRVLVRAGHGGRVRSVVKALRGAVAPERMTIIARQDDAALMDADLTELAFRPRVLLEPRDRGSAVGILLAAYGIWHGDPDATVAVIVAGRVVATAPTFAETLEEAGRFVNRYPRWILLLGARHERRTTGLWIVPESVLDCSETAAVWRVGAIRRGGRSHAFSAGSVFRGTGILVAKAARLVSRGRQFLPGTHSALLQAASLLGSRLEVRALQRTYALTPYLDLSTSLLEASVADLAVTEPAGAPWMSGLQPIRHVSC